LVPLQNVQNAENRSSYPYAGKKNTLAARCTPTTSGKARKAAPRTPAKCSKAESFVPTIYFFLGRS
ncbi:MAG TPA: hypothetical protein VIQ97_03730, partial [Prevotella sp.]